MKITIRYRAEALLLTVLLCILTTGAGYSDEQEPEMPLGSQVPGFRFLGGEFTTIPMSERLEGVKITFLGTTARSYDPSIIEEPVKDSGIKDSGAAYAALPDLAVSNLRLHEGFQEPLENMREIQFDFDIENKGTAPAENVDYNIHMDNRFFKKPQEGAGTIQPGETVTRSFQLYIKQGGIHSVIVKVNEDHAVQESSYTNNGAYKVCEWRECICLVAEKVQHEGGVRTFESNEQTFTYEIKNLGSIPTGRFFYKIESDGRTVFFGGLNTLNGYSSYKGQCNFIYGKEGTYIMRMYVDMQDAVKDVYRGDNVVSAQYLVTCDTELNGYVWEDARNLSVAILPDAAALMQNQNAGPGALESAKDAMRKWNGLNTGVSIGNITLAAEQAQGSEDITIKTELLKKPDLRTITLAETRIPEDDAHITRHAEIVINTDPEAFIRVDGAKQKRTFTHEFGHVLGLEHPNDKCRDIAIMRQDLDPLHSVSIEHHDRYNLDVAYPAGGKE